MSFTKEMIAEIIDEDGADNLTAKGVRTKLEAKLGVEAGALKSKKEDISKMIDDVLAEREGGAIAFLLRYLPARVIESACQAQASVFGGFVPEHKDLITVHMRRGDKCIGSNAKNNSALVHCEMHYISAQHFVDHVADIVSRKRIQTPSVFLTTEDRGAIEEFIAIAKVQKPHWRVGYYDRAVLPSNHGSPGVEVMKTAEALNGEAALPSLVALVLALEADSYILTKRSEWSVDIDALRQSRIDYICKGCTDVVDLSSIGVKPLTEKNGLHSMDVV